MRPGPPPPRAARGRERGVRRRRRPHRRSADHAREGLQGAAPKGEGRRAAVRAARVPRPAVAGAHTSCSAVGRRGRQGGAPNPGRKPGETRCRYPRARARGQGALMLRLPSFKYLQPRTLKEAFAMKADAGPEGMYVAGGTDLYPNMKRRHQEPRTVISLMGIRELAGYQMRDAGCALGSCMTLTELSASPPVRQSAPAVGEAAGLLSTPLLPNMGTLGGNLCLDTPCNYYNQSYEWRKAIDFCMKKDGHICWVAPSSPRCWAVSSSDVAP